MYGLRAHWLGWRNRLLSSPDFQRLAAGFPLTQPIARRRADALFDIVAGFVFSQILSACVQLDLFARLRDGPKTAVALAADTSLPPERISALAEAAASLDLLERVGEGYALGAHGAALLGQPGLSQMIAHHAAFYEDLRDPVRLLQEGRGEHLAQFWPYAGAASAGAGGVGDYSALMSATQPVVAQAVLDVYSFRRHSVVMDVGGGEGVFLSAVGARWPHLRLRLFDLPDVAARARAGGSNAECVGGDFLTDPLPSGADLITFVRVLHDHDDAGVTRLLASARAALAPGGRILVAEPMVGAGRLAGAYLAMYLLAMGRGRPRSPADLKAALAAAGFSKARVLRTRTPSLLQLLVAEAPGTNKSGRRGVLFD